jgi:hypothetical protein
VSNDNPFSEAQFKAFKYFQPFPGTVGRSGTPERSANASSPTTTSSTDTAASA